VRSGEHCFQRKSLGSCLPPHSNKLYRREQRKRKKSPPLQPGGFEVDRDGASREVQCEQDRESGRPSLNPPPPPLQPPWLANTANSARFVPMHQGPSRRRGIAAPRDSKLPAGVSTFLRRAGPSSMNAAWRARWGRPCFGRKNSGILKIFCHCCPVKSRPESIGCRDRVSHYRSRMREVPVKRAFFRIA
jgi:hypothetical protein